jgi:hypothetical protein
MIRLLKRLGILNFVLEIRFLLTSKILRESRGLYKLTDEKFKFLHILEAINYVRVALLPPVFFEFGCHSGRTFSAAINAANFLKLDLTAIAFDSFQGLPNTKINDDGYFEGGTFFTSENDFKKIVKRQTGDNLNDNQIIKGFYNESLNDDLKGKLPRNVGMVHIDVDLYSSTCSVLEFIRDYIVEGTVILFDDWYCFSPGEEKGEKKALSEFLKKNPNIKLEDWKNYSTFGKSFFVKSIK